MSRNRKKPNPKKRAERRARRLRTTLFFVGRLLAAVFVVIGVFASVVAVYVWGTTSHQFAVREVRVEGNGRAALGELVPLTGIRRGTNIFLVEPDAAARSLETHPWVRSAVVRRELPASVRIYIEEWEPAALAVLGKVYLVSPEGEPFKVHHVDDALDLVVITGLDGATAEGGESLRAELRDALGIVDEWKRAELPLELGEVHVDTVRGVTVTTAAAPKRPPLVAHLGREDFGRRLRRLSSLLTLLTERGEHPKEVFLDNHTRPQWVVARVD